VDEPGLRDERSTSAVEKCVGGGGWRWMAVDARSTYPITSTDQWSLIQI